MINYETILSSYDDKITLLEWLKKVEEALADASLSSVEVVQSASDKAYFKFIFADGTYLVSPQLTLPLGPVGPQGPIGERGEAGRDGEDGTDGADGVSVTNVSVNASNHLIVTLSNGSSIDAGEINVPTITVDSELSASSENPVQNKIIYTALGGKQDTLTFDSTPIQDSNNPVKSGGVYSALGGKQDALTTSSVADGTIDKSIGFDSLGNLVKGSGGGTQPTGQVTTTFTLPQDVQDMLTVPHGIIIFSKDINMNIINTNYPNINWCVGYYSAQSGMYNNRDSSTTLSSNIGGPSSTQYPFATSYKYFSSKAINGTNYYGCNRSRYSIAFLSYKSDNTSNVLPSLTISAKIIKIVSGNLITETISGTVTSQTVTSASASSFASIDLAITKSVDDLILLIEIDSLTVN